MRFLPRRDEAGRGGAHAVAALTSSIYGSTVFRMKTTFDIPDDLLVRAKKRAAELRQPLRSLVTAGLRSQLATPPRTAGARKAARRRIRWVTTPGGLPPGLDVADRGRMHDWLRRGS